MRYGAAVVVMAFDEQGQADTLERKFAICQARLRDPGRGGRLSARGHHLRSQYFRGRDRHRGAQQLRRRLHRGGARNQRRCPLAHISGGVSNLSFSFRGNEPVREAMHSVFLYHAIDAGMDMGIVNAGQLAVYDEIDAGAARGLRGRRAQPPPRLRPSACSTLAERFKGAGAKAQEKDARLARGQPVDKRLEHALVNGVTEYIDRDVEEARLRAQPPARRHRGAADGRHECRRRSLRPGKMFLPQVVKSARVMKQAVAYLLPFMDAEKAERRRALERRQNPAGDGQGRRSRHRQEHRRRRARLQQLRGHRSRRHGAGGENSRDGAGARRSTPSASPGSSRPRSTRCASSPPRWSARGSTCRC